MSLLSKLLGGDKDAENEVKNLISGLFGNAKQGQNASTKEDTPVQNTPSDRPAESTSPSGFSWGDDMPAEENQYNYNGSYEQYFEHVFSEDFPAYRFEKKYIDDYGKHRVIYTFFRGEAKALVIELMTESSEAVKFRNDCRKAGIPYLRFYYDHNGWWNTRAYVDERMRSVLNG